MMKRLALLVLAACLVLLVGAVSAQDAPEGGDPKDNLCYEGGAWDDGRCNIPQYAGATELAWICGWYMARVYDGRLPASAVPTQCEHLLQTGGLSQLCRTFESEFEEEPEGEDFKAAKLGRQPWAWTVCLFASQFGTETQDGVPFADYTYLFVDNTDDCPNELEYQGNVYFLDWTGQTSEFTGWYGEGFTEDELFSQLGLKPYYCAYYID